MNEDLRNLILRAKKGDTIAFSELSIMYTPLFNRMTVSFMRAKGMDENDKDDLLQEASIALYNAIESYDLSQEKVTFGLYAKICIRNRIISLLRKRQREVKLLNRDSPKAFRKPVRGDSGFEPSDNSKSLQYFDHAKSVLSSYEYAVFKLYIQDLAYRDIAKILNRTEKSVDNALSRIKNKMKR